MQNFSNLSSWEDRYRKIIEMGKDLSPLNEAYRTDDLKVRGCQSQVWLHAEKRADGRLYFTADSDALIVKGLVAILLMAYSEKTPEEILEFKSDFVKELGLDTHLSPSRANGLFAMIRQIQYYALAFKRA